MQKNTHSSTARWRWTGSTWWTWGRTGCRMRRWDIQDLHQTGASSRNLRSQRTSPVKWTTSVSCPDTLFRKLPPVPGTNSNYNTIDRIKKGKCSDFVTTQDGMPNYSPFYLQSVASYFYPQIELNIFTQSGQTSISIFIIFECFL